MGAAAERTELADPAAAGELAAPPA
jgi:hypothetical protein